MGLQLSLTSYTVSSSPKVPAAAKCQVTKKTVKFCCRDVVPFATIEGEGFLELAQELINVGATYGRVKVEDVLPDVTMVSKHTATETEHDRKVLVKEISDIISAGLNVSMTTDMWSDSFRQASYTSVTCHYVTEDFQLKSRVLVTAKFPLEEAKSGENIRRELKRLLISVLGFDANVFNKVMWVTDQGANILKALEPYPHMSCIDHTINTALKHALDLEELKQEAPEVGETIVAVKALVKYVKKSGINSTLSTTAKQMADTRFSSVFLTLQSVNAVYGELTERLTSRDESHRMDNISPEILSFLVDFLRPFHEAQKELEGDKYPTIQLVLIWYEKLTRHCEPDPSDTPYQATIRRRHLEWLERKIEITPLHKLALFLWPKFSQLRMMDTGQFIAI